MNCPLQSREGAEQMLDYCTRKLDAETTAQFDAHVAGCSACREFAGRQHAVWQALDTWEAAPVSANFDSRLFAKIEQDVPWWQSLLRPLRPLVRHWNVAASAAGVFVLLTAGLLLNHPDAVAPVQDAQQQIESVQPEQVVHALDAMDMLADFDSHVNPTAHSNAKM